MFNFPLHLEFVLKFRNVVGLGEHLTRINIVFHEKQEKIQSMLLDGGQRSHPISQIEKNLISRKDSHLIYVDL